MNREYLLGEEKLHKAIFVLTLPATLSALSTVIYNIIDTIFIGKYVGDVGIAAISIYLPIQMIISASTLLFASGIGSFISRQIGAKHYDKAEESIGTLFAFITTLAIILCILGVSFPKQIVELFSAEGSIIPYATNYARMMFIGTLFFPLCLASNNVMRAEGSANYSMYGTVISIASNIILDYIFIVLLRWGVTGAGLATTLSKFINFLYIVYYFKFKAMLKIRTRYIRYNIDMLKKAIPIGFSTFLNQLTGSISIVLLNNVLYSLGSTESVAIYGIVYKLTSLIQRSAGGFSRGSQPLIGYNFGAKNFKRIKDAVKFSAIISTSICLIATIIMIILSKDFVAMFTNDLSLINNCSHVLRITLLASPLLGVYFLSIAFYRAIGYAKQSIILSMLRRIIFFIPMLYILPYVFNLGVLGVWIALPLSNLIASLVAICFLIKDSKFTKKIKLYK